MPDRTFLGWPFFDDAHRELAARLAARLSHPNLVPVIDADKPVGDSWVVDEPSPEVVGAWDLARAGQLDAPVLVDQRAWFHRVGCADLRGQVAERVPIARAIDLGLVPCGRCRPVTTVLTDLDTAAGGPGD